MANGNSFINNWGGDESWGSRFWVTLVDPLSNEQFYACPGTGAVSWDPPVGHFVLPPSETGEWWELSSDSHNGLSYYYHTKTKETVWERPEGFIIPLGVLQGTTLARKDSTKSNATATTKNIRKSVSLDRTGSLGRPQNTRQTVSSGPHNSSNHENGAPRRAQLSVAPGLGTIPGSTSDLPLDEHGRKDKSANGADSFGRKTKGQRVPGTQTLNGHHHSHNHHNHNHYYREHHTIVQKQSHPPASLDAAAALFASSPRNEMGSSIGHKPPSSPARTPPKGKGQAQSQSLPPTPQQQYTGSSFLDVVMAPRRSTSGDRRSGSPALHPLQHLKAFAQRSQPDLVRHPYGLPSEEKTGSGKLKMNGKEVTISSPLLQRKSTGGSSLNGLDNKIPVDSAVLKESPPITVSPTISRDPSRADSQDNGANQNQVNELTRTMTIPNGVPAPQTISRQASSHAPHRSIPHTLATEISQFASTDFARTYFATHRRGLIWRRKIPVEEMMSWSKSPLSTPLLMLPKNLHRDAVRVFKAIQLVMGDKEAPPQATLRSTASQISLGSGHGHGHQANFPRYILEEERWLLTQGILHGEMRDEIYCQMVKQLNGCPSLENMFKGWQLLCVLLITFPPSKNLEEYLRRFILERCGQDHSRGRINILAKYALNRLIVISRKGPRGKPPTLSEIITASDAPFNPSIFGEPLDSIMRLQSRTAYAELKVPIVLPFLADGILALGGMQSEGIFRVQGDPETMAEMRSKLDRGFYSLDGSGGGGVCEDANVLAGLLKLWLRELQDPLIPDEMYGDCIQTAARFREAQTAAGGPVEGATHQLSKSLTSVDREKERLAQEEVKESKDQEIASIIARLPTINRRVVLFVVSFLQLFLDEKVIKSTKMTSANIALVMAPNLLRCRSDSMRVVFTNAQYEQTFVHDLLMHLKCDAVDPDYIPSHGMGARTGMNKRS